MSENKEQILEEQETVEVVLEEETQNAEQEVVSGELESVKAQLAQQEDKYLRLAAEY